MTIVRPNIIPLHRGVRMPRPPADYDTRPQRPDLYRSLVDGIRPIRRTTLVERTVEFFRHRGDLIVGLIAGTGFGCLLTAALAIGGQG